MSKQTKEKRLKISHVKVMKSNAGYYIGRSYFDEELQNDIPYSRLSAEYFTDYIGARTALDTGDFTMRNAVLRQNTTIPVFNQF